MISKAQVLPTAVLLIGFMAAVVYTFQGDWRRALYWYSAAAITFSVTF